MKAIGVFLIFFIYCTVLKVRDNVVLLLCVSQSSKRNYLVSKFESWIDEIQLLCFFATFGFEMIL